MKKFYKHLFGPVPSRRLGRSLGIDLVPMKTCSVNCVFCQLGAENKTTVERAEYIPTDEIIGELKDWLANDGVADHATLSGSGEPTLHTGFGEVLSFLKENSNIKSVLLTNSSLFHLSEVRDAAKNADIVKVSLSAWDQESFVAVNRPCDSLSFDLMVDGLRKFRSEFSGQIWMEVFLVPGVNTHPDQVAKIAKIAETISPDKIQLNTAVRPPAESFVQVVPESYLKGLVNLFIPKAEIIASYNADESSQMALTNENVLNLISRHPATIGQIAQMTGCDEESVAEIMKRLSGQVSVSEINGETYYLGNIG